MKDSKEIKLRQYLLGKLDDREELEDAWSRELLFNDELSDQAEAIEDEIIEEYLDGTLDPGDRKAVEEYFMRPPERLKKLQFARLLRDRFAAMDPQENLTPSPAPADITPELVSGPDAVLSWRPYFRTGVEVFAVLLMVTSFIYVFNLHSRLQTQITEGQEQQKQLADKLDQQTTLAANLARRLEELQPPVAILSLTSALRDNEGMDEVEIKPWTQRIQVDVVVDGSASTYDVRLENAAQQVIWAETNLPSSAAGAQLVFDMPPQGIKTGKYSLIVSSKQGSFRKPFYFRATVKSAVTK